MTAYGLWRTLQKRAGGVQDYDAIKLLEFVVS